MSKVVALTGITGQFGSALATKFLNETDYKVYGLVRKCSTFNTQRIDHILNHPNLDLSYGDLADTNSINNFVHKSKPDYFFNAGALSQVRTSFDIIEYTLDVDGIGVARVLEALRMYSPNTRFCQLSTSELFGSSPPPQLETTPMNPQSPYGIAKLAGYWMTKLYRQSYGMFSVSMIASNYESRLRSQAFITAKCVHGLYKIKTGLQKELFLGNLDSYRSFNHLNDIIDGALLIINADKPDDYVVGANKMISIRDFLDKVAAKLQVNWKDHVKFDKRLLRPSEVHALEPDSTKIRTELGWKPKYTVDDIIDEMINECEKLYGKLP